MDAHDILVTARNLIATEGHLKHRVGGRGEGYCAVGALTMATYGDMGCRAAVDAAAGWALKEATERLTHNSLDLVGWNNAPERTETEVLALFDEAIARTAPEPWADLDLNQAPSDYESAALTT